METLKPPNEFIGAMPVRQDITVPPADDPKALRLGWVIYERIIFAVINDYAAANIIIETVYEVKRIIEDPIFDIEDWIDESYWPEWEITFHDGEKTVIKAPDQYKARSIAEKMKNGTNI